MLARWLVTAPEITAGKVIYELGSGCGLGGMTAAVLAHARRIVLTDLTSATLDNLRHNIRINDGARAAHWCEPEVLSVDWRHHDTWPLDAYIMVFGSRSDALAYAKWHSWKGDPSSSKLARAAARARLLGGRWAARSDMKDESPRGARSSRRMRGRIELRLRIRRALSQLATHTSQMTSQDTKLLHIRNLLCLFVRECGMHSRCYL